MLLLNFAIFKEDSFQESLKKVCTNGYKNYVKSRPAASKDSVRRAKNINLEKMEIHSLFANVFGSEIEKQKFISKMRKYKPQTVK